MGAFEGLLIGFQSIITPEILIFMVLGCALGMVTGVLPGFGPPSATALLLPVVFLVSPTASIAMIASIYYGSMYGGTITAILLNVPGEAASVATGLDGYQMTKRGLGGKALAISAIGSFVGGFIAMIGMVFASNFAILALKLTYIDIFALSLLALIVVIGLTGKSMIKGLIPAALGLFVGTVGIDHFSGAQRFTFGNPDMASGISYIAVIMGIFGLTEILTNLGQKQLINFASNIGPTRVSFSDIRETIPSMGRGTVVGFFFGLMPGSPSAAAAFTSYAVEKRFSKHPERFGKGAIQGVVGPDTAANALAISNFIPLMTLGIPSSSTMAIIFSALIVNGLQPGPLLFEQHPEVAWGIIASLVVANVILLIMALPLVRVWVSVLKIPTELLYPAVLGVMTLGAYAVNNNIFDVIVMWCAGLVGFILTRLDMPLAPAALTLVLGPMLEGNFRRGLSIGKPLVETFLSSPLAVTCYLVMIAVFAWKGIGVLRKLIQARSGKGALATS
ncbi:MAG: tripartite tricarboxylate transporter permease [Propionibacteriaceae bacterium]|jgi:putative tricarboxylic transport membrane protein|nr:tripartite tricarboxylate transporter permease [Propionibacteriaceae bacterium]